MRCVETRDRSLNLEERQSLLEGSRDVAELCSAGWEAELASDELGYSAEISKQRVGGAAWFLCCL